MFRTSAIAITLTWPMSGTAIAQDGGFWTAGRLLGYCQTEALGYDSGLCQGYMRGYIELLRDPDVSNLAGVCIPDEATLGQSIRIFKKFGAEHPEAEHLPASIVLMAANLNAFPCPSDNGE